MRRIFARYPGTLPPRMGILCVWLLLVFAPGLQAAEAARSIVVTLGDYRFMPDTISALTGETVRLELNNTDNLTPHNFSLQAAEAGLDVDVDVSAGHTEVIEITPLAAGTYTFFCNKKLPFMKSHRDHGMEGTLVVGPAGDE